MAHWLWFGWWWPADLQVFPDLPTYLWSVAPWKDWRTTTLCTKGRIGAKSTSKNFIFPGTFLMHVLYSIQRLQQYMGRHWQCSGVGMLGFPQGGWRRPVVLTKVYLGVLVQIKECFLTEIRWKAIYWQCWRAGIFTSWLKQGRLWLCQGEGHMRPD